ncbi:MAG: SseB family protein [Rhodoglobus sp.]
MSDSAGVPWAGRRFTHSLGSDDDGSAPQILLAAIRGFHSGDLGEAAVVDALRSSRLLIPLVAVAGELAVNDHGHSREKSQELSVVTVEGPDGRSVLPAFTSVAAMTVWNPVARPVPVAARRVALAAAGDGTELIVLDPRNATEFVLRRPAVLALAQSQSWRPSYLDLDVLSAFMDAAHPESAITAVHLAPGDPAGRLAGPELLVQLSLVPGLDAQALDAITARLQDRWARDSVIASRVDSLRLTFVPAR